MFHSNRKTLTFIVSGSAIRRFAPLMAATTATFGGTMMRTPSAAFIPMHTMGSSTNSSTTATAVAMTSKRFNFTASSSTVAGGPSVAVSQRVPFTDMRKATATIAKNAGTSPRLDVALAEMRALSIGELREWVACDDNSIMDTADVCCVGADLLVCFKDFDRAAVLYERAMELSPNDVSTLFNFAVMLEDHVGDVARAIALYEHANKVCPSDERASLKMANLYADKLRDYEKAAHLFKRVAVLKPFHPSAAKSAMVAEALAKGMKNKKKN